MSATEPTAAQLRTARQLGAKAGLNHLPEDKSSKLLEKQKKILDRRDKNVSEFKAKVLNKPANS